MNDNLQRRVINRHGQPVSGAQMEIWQANSHGRYTHQSDQHDAPLYFSGDPLNDKDRYLVSAAANRDG